MNDEPSSSASAAFSGSTSQSGHDAATRAKEIAERYKKNREMFNRKRGELLDDLLRNLDILAYGELSVIYYMDCSFLGFLIRAFPQFVFLTPKPAIFPQPPANRPFFGGIVGTNLLCILLHLNFAAPSAGEATRGYLHGGAVMDFIGQKGPSSKIHLLILDILLLFIQIVQLAAHLTRQRLRDDSVPLIARSGRLGSPNTGGQDLDAEERGVRRSMEQQDIEMQTLNTSGTAQPVPTGEGDSERASLLAAPAARTDAHIFDAFNSGQIVIADLNILNMVKEQLVAIREGSGEPSPSVREMQSNIFGQLSRWGNGPTVGRRAVLG